MTTGASDTPAGVSLGDAATSGVGSDGNTEASKGAEGTALAIGSPASSNEAPWYGTLKDEGLKTLAQSKGWDSPEAAVKSYKELEVLHSKGGVAMTPPATAKDYQLNVPTGIPKEAYNEDFADWFKNTAHKAGLSQEKAAILHDGFLEYAKSSIEGAGTAATEKFSKAAQTAQQQLETAWGAAGTPSFTRNIELAKRAIRLADPALMGALEEVGAVKKVNGTPVVLNATLVQAFAKMGAGMFAEDSLHGDIPADKNPFDPKSEDLAMQGRLVRQDPDKADALIRAVGRQNDFRQFYADRASKK